MTDIHPTQQELKYYEDSVNAYRDIINAIKTAEKKSRAEGRAEEKIAIAKKVLAMNMTKEDIAKVTGLAVDEISKLI